MARRNLLRFLFVAIPMAVCLAVMSPSTAQKPPPGPGGCTAYVSNMSKSGSTIYGTFTVGCSSRQNYISSSGSIHRASSGKHLATNTDYCTNCLRQNTVVKWKGDPAGSQGYDFIFEPAGTGAGASLSGSASYDCVDLRCFYQRYTHSF